MKKSIYKLALGLSVIAAVGLQSCDKLKSAIIPDYSFTQASSSFTLDPISDTTQNADMNTVVYLKVDSLLGTIPGGASIKTAKITKVTLTVDNPDVNNNLANFKMASATFNSNANGGSYAPYDVADISSNPDVYAQSIDLPLLSAGTDVKKYLSGATSFSYLIVGKLRRATTKQLTCHVDVSYTLSF